ncbi:isochorismatase family cysteine hydrolase [Metabacillus idriensis]|uniref:isochorismatase family cysteine hydrolase n=1 Tax=Metabacillus idriensis TaxID=324768 RepID=UPI001749D82F|nr:isochorismatase family cysteine hydrolase [Metabacillus idriensis]
MEKKDSCALLIIDMINNFKFKHGEVLAEQANQVSEQILELKKKMQQKNYPIIYINDHYKLWQADFQKISEKCTNDLSRPIIEKLYPDETDFFLIKPMHSAFYGTALNMLLDNLYIKHLILKGIAGNICVLFSANDAFMRGYKLSVPSDCIASNDKEDNEYALRMMENVLKADTSNSSTLKI